jgi:YggT family protein
MLLSLIDTLFLLFQALILARVILSWLNPDPSHPISRFIYDATEPVLAPVRNFIGQYVPPSMPIDFSPLIVLLLAGMLRSIVFSLF